MGQATAMTMMAAGQEDSYLSSPVSRIPVAVKSVQNSLLLQLQQNT